MYLLAAASPSVALGLALVLSLPREPRSRDNLWPWRRKRADIVAGPADYAFVNSMAMGLRVRLVSLSPSFKWLFDIERNPDRKRTRSSVCVPLCAQPLRTDDALKRADSEVLRPTFALVPACTWPVCCIQVGEPANIPTLYVCDSVCVLLFTRPPCPVRIFRIRQTHHAEPR